MNSQIGEIDVKFGDRSYTLRPRFSALCEIEDLTGRGVMQIANDMSRGVVRAKDVVAIIYAGVKAGTKDFKDTIDEFGDFIINEGHINHATNVSVRFLATGIVGSKIVTEQKKSQTAEV